MSTVLFENISPSHTIWVSPQGSASGDGSETSPYASIHQALNTAQPGSAIMVKAGTYTENVKFMNGTQGTADAPVWLISADGPQAAKIIAADPAQSVIYASGEDNLVIRGFEIHGGVNGIHVGVGNNGTDIAQNILIQNNHIYGSSKDGIKIDHADAVQVSDNIIRNAGDQGIDFVAVQGGIIAHNEMSQIAGYTALLVKGGTSDVLITRNWVHDTAGDGLSVGGWTQPQLFRSGTEGYEARNITATENRIEGTGKYALGILGAQDSLIANNYFATANSTKHQIHAATGSPDLATPPSSLNVTVTGNVFPSDSRLLLATSDSQINFHDNRTDGVWSLSTGPRIEGPVPTPETATPVVWTHQGTSGADSITGSTGDDAINGGTGDDTLFAGRGNDTVQGGAGNDYIRGELGNDTLSGGTGNDVISGGRNNDVLFGGDGQDTLDGGEENDLLYGEDGNDRLVGAGGDDRLDGGRGADLLKGGTGSDIFVLRQGETSGDTLLDFTSQDLIVFSGFSPDAVLSYASGQWTITDSHGSESFVITGVSQLQAGDFILA